MITISRAQKRRLMVAVMQNIIKSKEKEEDGSSSASWIIWKTDIRCMNICEMKMLTCMSRLDVKTFGMQ